MMGWILKSRSFHRFLLLMIAFQEGGGWAVLGEYFERERSIGCTVQLIGGGGRGK